ncbi:MAG: hypothetical protein AAFR38_08670 [Planctomycetota bacterium]
MTGLAPADWAVLGAYAVATVAIGFHFGGRVTDRESLLTGGRRTPVWAIAISVVATSVSGVTFLGAPQAAYAGDLSYLSASIASVLASVAVALVFLPRFYAVGASTVYEAIGQRAGRPAQRACAVAFLIGRLLASGVRLYVAAIPCSLILFGGLETGQLLISVALLGLIAVAYSAWGGIRAVIATDALQALVMIVAVAAGVWVLLGQLPERVQIDDAEKLRVIDWSLDLSRPFTIWSVLLGLTLFNAAAFATDQDLAQRLLTASSAEKASRSLILSGVLGVGMVGIFLAVGLLLYLRDQAAGTIESDDTRRVFLAFMLQDLPIGLRGMLVAGLFAAAMSSTDSALNAMSSSLVVDFGLGRSRLADARLVSIACGAALTLCAGAFALSQGGREEGLIPFALGVMIYAYAGLLGVFISVLLLGRGSTVSVVTALVLGAAVVALLATGVLGSISIGWRMLAGTLVSAAACSLVGARTAI